MHSQCTSAGSRSVRPASFVTNITESENAYCGGARLARSPQAASRARARDERVAAGDERIGWGGCGPTGVRWSRGRVVHAGTVTVVSNRLGRVWPNWCPGVARSCCSRWYCHSRIESAGEGVAQLVSGGRAVVLCTLVPSQSYRIGSGRCGTPRAPVPRRRLIHSTPPIDRTVAAGLETRGRPGGSRVV